MIVPYIGTWWFIPRIVSRLVHPSCKWINPTNIPFITKVITYLISGMNHQVVVLITIVTGAYKPTNITGGPHIVGEPTSMVKRQDWSPAARSDRPLRGPCEL